ncbi:AAA family ATPase [Bordetella hinzii]|uniref:McrB family protein n=1 Tax=Bordetella hinzii TaxID=103855 RepID=UPI0039FC2D1D|nr:AAA family ATPase [Bordetella hinzii]
MARLIEDNEEIHDLAIQALKAMLSKFGPNHRFPTDAIWEFIPDNAEIKSTKKPHQPKRLVKEGYLQDTGIKTRAQSGPRAGSPTTEYRFGHVLVPENAAPASGSIPIFTAQAARASSSHSDAIRGIQEAMEAEGYVVSSAELANFFLAMTVSPLVILSGISGTGKSLMPRKFAKFTKSFFQPIPVQPQWTDNSDLFGYVPSLASGTFVQGKIIDSILQAKRNPGSLVIALLDEMNLAPVEHYFSDFLSVAESRERKGDRVGSDPLPIDLPTTPEAPFVSLCSELTGIELPHNLRVVGTANMDESTHSFSPKVLDRAFTIEFDDPDLTTFAIGGRESSATFESLAQAAINPGNAINIMEAQARSQDIFEQIAAWLEEIQGILSPAGIKFGYRTRDAILLYLHFWREFGLSDVLAGCAAFDFCILQKILPKIYGSGDALETALTKLAKWLAERSELEHGIGSVEAEFAGSLERSHEKVTRMLALLDIDGATRYWGA